MSNTPIKPEESLVVVGKHKDKLAKRQDKMKVKLMALKQSRKLNRKIFRELPAEEGIELYKKTQLGKLLMNSEAAILSMEKAANGDLSALDEYKTYVQAGLVLANELATFKKIYEDLKPVDDSKIPRPYKAPELSKEEWEKKFNPGKPVPPEEVKQEEMYSGPTPSSVN